jgi:thiamine transporter ThiT
MTWGFLLLATVVGPQTLIHPNAPLFADQFQVAPVMMLASLKLASAFYRHRAGDLLTGLVIFALLPMVVELPQVLQPWRSFLSLHLAYVAVLIVTMFRSDHAEWRRASAVLLLATLITGLVILIRRHESPTVLAAYFVAMTVFAAASYRWLNERWYLVVTILNCFAGFLGGFAGAFWTLSTAHMESGMRQVIFGGISFLAAVVISILKTDVGRRLKLRLLLGRRAIVAWLFESNGKVV